MISGLGSLLLNSGEFMETEKRELKLRKLELKKSLAENEAKLLQLDIDKLKDSDAAED